MASFPVRSLLHHENRSKGLLLDDVRGRLIAKEDCRRIELCPMRADGTRLAPEWQQQGVAIGSRAVDEGGHALSMRRVDQGADNCVGFCRIAPFQGRACLEQQRYERLAAIVVHDDAAVGSAALTRHFEGAGRHGARCCSEIGVGPDDGGIVATKLGLEWNVPFCANILRRASGGRVSR